MVSFGQNQLVSFAGWYFLPKIVGYAQSFWYSLTIRAGDPWPHPGSSRYKSHRRTIHISIIVLYLLFNFYEADWDLVRRGDFYRDLGLAHDVDDRALQSRFRRLTVKFHPDKVASAAPHAQEAATAYFRHLKEARDTLADPVKRFAYDRFGPRILKCQRCSTYGDYLLFMWMHIAQHFTGLAAAMFFFNLFGYIQWGRYWRYLTLAVVAVGEVHTITRPSFPAILSKVINPIFVSTGLHPPYLPFQLVELVEQLMTASFIALAQIVPLLRPEGANAGDTEASKQEQLDHLNGTIRKADAEVSRLLALETVPLSGSEQAISSLRFKLREWFVENTIGDDPRVRNAIEMAIQRRRQVPQERAEGARET